jgi:hypothetical protein
MLIEMVLKQGIGVDQYRIAFGAAFDLDVFVKLF